VRRGKLHEQRVISAHRHVGPEVTVIWAGSMARGGDTSQMYLLF
jgi:hypothetical protein